MESLLTDDRSPSTLSKKRAEKTAAPFWEEACDSLAISARPQRASSPRGFSFLPTLVASSQLGIESQCQLGHALRNPQTGDG